MKVQSEPVQGQDGHTRGAGRAVGSMQQQRLSQSNSFLALALAVDQIVDTRFPACCALMLERVLIVN